MESLNPLKQLPYKWVFLDEEKSDHPTDSQTVKRVPSSGSTNSHQTVVDGSPVPKTDSTSLSKENSRSRVGLDSTK
jgi:hypothetical protein